MARGFNQDSNKKYTPKTTATKEASRALMEKACNRDRSAFISFTRPAYYGTIAQVNGGECYVKALQVEEEI